jgi:DNA primase
MSSNVEKIKEKLGIEEVIGSYIKLERAGKNLKGKCPFHNEKTPSFFVTPERGGYYCFGCGASGDIFTFVEEFEGLDFKGALKLLADRAGVALEVYTKENKEKESEKEKLYRVMEEATKHFEHNLKGNLPVLQYLKSRGLTEQSIKDFRIGFAILDWRKLFDYLKSRGFADEIIEHAGLAKRPEDKNKGMYDRFRGRVMFPISDSSGRVIAFSGRIFVDDGKSAKYLNSPETPIFSKNAVLYGLDKAKTSIRNNNFSILVEGQMDLVLSHQAGYKNTIATSGTALSDSTVSKENVVSNLGLVRRLSPNIVLAFDADKAGFNASNRAGRIALSLGMDVKVASMGEGMDPADLISKKGSEAWKEVIRNSKHIIEFLLDMAMKNSKGDMRKVGRVIKESILPYVDALSSSIEKSHFIKKISDISGVPQSALQDDLKTIEQEFKYEKDEIVEATGLKQKMYRKDYILRKLFGIVFWQDTLKEKNIETKNILDELSKILNKDTGVLLGEVGDKKEDFIFEAEVFYGGIPSEILVSKIDQDVKELLFNLKEEYLKEELEKRMRELSQAEEQKDFTKSAQILKIINDLSSQIQFIKNSRTK